MKFSLNAYILIVVVNLLSGLSYADGSLEPFCKLNDGVLVEEYNCPASGVTRKGAFCIIKNDQNEDLVFNGCTGVKGEYGDIFFKACTLHDFCYHNEPAVSGKSKKDCDKKLYADALNICENEREKDDCRRKAKLFYLGVKVGGKKSWECSKNSAGYPDTLEYL